MENVNWTPMLKFIIHMRNLRWFVRARWYRFRYWWQNFFEQRPRFKIVSAYAQAVNATVAIKLLVEKGGYTTEGAQSLIKTWFELAECACGVPPAFTMVKENFHISLLGFASTMFKDEPHTKYSLVCWVPRGYQSGDRKVKTDDAFKKIKKAFSNIQLSSGVSISLLFALLYQKHQGIPWLFRHFISLGELATSSVFATCSDGSTGGGVLSCGDGRLRAVDPDDWMDGRCGHFSVILHGVVPLTKKT